MYSDKMQSTTLEVRNWLRIENYLNSVWKCSLFVIFSSHNLLKKVHSNLK